LVKKTAAVVAVSVKTGLQMLLITNLVKICCPQKCCKLCSYV